MGRVSAGHREGRVFGFRAEGWRGTNILRPCIASARPWGCHGFDCFRDKVSEEKANEQAVR